MSDGRLMFVWPSTMNHDGAAMTAAKLVAAHRHQASGMAIGKVVLALV